MIENDSDRESAKSFSECDLDQSDESATVLAEDSYVTRKGWKTVSIISNYFKLIKTICPKKNFLNFLYN